MARIGGIRHKSIVKTDVCTVWHPVENLWWESDADLRLRLNSPPATKKVCSVHRWDRVRIAGSASEPTEYVDICKECGVEKTV